MISGRSQAIPRLEHRAKATTPMDLSSLTSDGMLGSGSTFSPSTTASIPAPDTASSSGNVLMSGNRGHPTAPSVTPSADHIDENDIIIAVMGLTGAGKSTFVNKATGGAVPTTDSLWPQTQTVQSVRCTHPDGRRNIVLVDTPGFDDIHHSDVEVLKMIATWLKETYQSNIKLTGVLYLHRISDNRITQTSLRNLSVFRDLCGDSNLKNVVLVTTMWGEVEESIGSEREKQLLSDSEFWRALIHHGSRVCRFQGTYESAWGIVNCLDLEGSRRTPLQIQQEMVDRRLPFHKTSAAKTLLRSLVVELKRVWARMRSGIRGKGGARAPESQSLRRQALSRSPTTGSRSSVSCQSLVLTDSSSSSSYHTTHPTFNSSPTESNSSGCSANGRRDTLLAMITGLRVAHQVADMSSIPMLRGAIGTVLQIAQMIEGMSGTHHAISEVIEYSGWLLEEIAQYAAGTRLSKDMKKTLNSFQRELKNLQNVVKKISGRSVFARSLLYNADMQTIAACTAAIKAIYDKVEVRLAMDNLQAIARLEVRLIELCVSKGSWQCECGGSVILEESYVPQPSTISQPSTASQL